MVNFQVQQTKSIDLDWANFGSTLTIVISTIDLITTSISNYRHKLISCDRNFRRLLLKKSKELVVLSGFISKYS
jgi:hypothetical protein